MKTTSIILFLCVISFAPSYSQYKVPLSLLSNSGNLCTTLLNGKPVSIDWSIGEVLIGLGSANGMMMAIGEQQNLRNWSLHIVESIYRDVKIYPNPTANYLQIDNLPEGLNSLQLFDLNGNRLYFQYINQSAHTIATGHLPTGLYTLHIIHQNELQATFKISIHNH